ncbi:hypothetical protein GZ77_13815 [Endozoicomonas montiporae]|uniref:Uncharacterized protein n=2 Tax=Endozoicomonas montiporae TaxID=1027273 RepID=A0A081N4S3_9GAMM|nr:hypothetical protein EZMO1_3725 [Endozoicomonas montiporae CL-33]KEQ13446.1 hypothetical protein GZ77_13815 [Endozoicomonas montiporae]
MAVAGTSCEGQKDHLIRKYKHRLPFYEAMAPKEAKRLLDKMGKQLRAECRKRPALTTGGRENNVKRRLPDDTS